MDKIPEALLTEYPDVAPDDVEWVRSYFVGLDLGQSQDYTALVAVERIDPRIKDHGIRVVETDGALGKCTTTTLPPVRPRPAPTVETKTVTTWPRNMLDKLKSRRYNVIGLKRWDLGTPYDAIVDEVVQRFNTPPLLNGNLAIDNTGVGAAVVNYFVRSKPKCRLVPITITGGSGCSARAPLLGESFSGFNVAKKELVGILQLVLQHGRIQLPKVHPLTAVTLKELENFKVKITNAGNDGYEAWREKSHDDIVLALATALWVSEKASNQFWMR